eukprot:1034061-Karenia_brevis.AAC.1
MKAPRTELHEKIAEKDQQLQSANEELQRATANVERLMEIDGVKQSVIDEQEATIQDKPKTLQDVALAAGQASQEASDLKDALHETKSAHEFKDAEIHRLTAMMQQMDRQLREQSALVER